MSNPSNQYTTKEYFALRDALATWRQLMYEHPDTRYDLEEDMFVAHQRVLSAYKNTLKDLGLAT